MRQCMSGGSRGRSGAAVLEDALPAGRSIARELRQVVQIDHMYI